MKNFQKMLLMSFVTLNIVNIHGSFGKGIPTQYTFDPNSPSGRDQTPATRRNSKPNSPAVSSSSATAVKKTPTITPEVAATLEQLGDSAEKLNSALQNLTEDENLNESSLKLLQDYQASLDHVNQLLDDSSDESLTSHLLPGSIWKDVASSEGDGRSDSIMISAPRANSLLITAAIGGLPTANTPARSIHSQNSSTTSSRSSSPALSNIIKPQGVVDTDNNNAAGDEQKETNGVSSSPKQHFVATEPVIFNKVAPGSHQVRGISYATSDDQVIITHDDAGNAHVYLSSEFGNILNQNPNNAELRTDILDPVNNGVAISKAQQENDILNALIEKYKTTRPTVGGESSSSRSTSSSGGHDFLRSDKTLATPTTWVTPTYTQAGKIISWLGDHTGPDKDNDQTDATENRTTWHPDSGRDANDDAAWKATDDALTEDYEWAKHQVLWAYCLTQAKVQQIHNDFAKPTVEWVCDKINNLRK